MVGRQPEMTSWTPPEPSARKITLPTGAPVTRSKRELEAGPRPEAKALVLEMNTHQQPCRYWERCYQQLCSSAELMTQVNSHANGGLIAANGRVTYVQTAKSQN